MATLYYVIGPSSGWSDPTAANVKAGQLSGGSSATASGSETSRTDTGTQTFATPASGLTAGTSYKIAFVWSDGSADSAVAVSAAFTTSALLLPTKVTNTSTFGTAVVGRGAVPVTPTKVTNTSTFGSATVSTGAATLAPTKYTNTNTFGTAVVGRGAVSLTPTKVSNTSTFGTPSVTARATLSPTKVANASTFGTPTVGRGAVNLSPTLYANASTFGAPVVQLQGSLFAGLYVNVNTFGTPSVSGGGSRQAGGGLAKRKYRRKYIVEVDGQDFAVESEEDARALLESAKETAQEVVEQAIVKAKAVPPTLKAPRIRVRGEVGPELQSLIAEVALVRQQIRDLYERAKRDAEIAYLMQVADDEEAIALLL